jgi:hypothetical protein
MNMTNPISIDRIAKQFCETAGDMVSNDRASAHGDANRCFDIVARLWSQYLLTNIAGNQVPIMMVLLKIARSMNGNFNKDDYIDMCGYSALAGEMATKQFEAADGDQTKYRGKVNE